MCRGRWSRWMGFCGRNAVARAERVGKAEMVRGASGSFPFLQEDCPGLWVRSCAALFRGGPRGWGLRRGGGW